MQKQKNPLDIPCTYCNARTHEPCRNKLTGEPLQKFPAHTNRVTAAQKVIPIQANQ